LRERPTILGEILDQISTEHSRAKSIAAELYNVAKANDALGAVGGSTSWRWQEGLISRMPKASTVAAVLTKAFESEDPLVWYEKVPKTLKGFVSDTYGLTAKRVLRSGTTISDIYDSVVIVSVSTGTGATKEDLIYKLCSLKYAKSLDEDDDYELPDESFILSTYRPWAERKLEKVLLKNKFKYINKNYTVGAGHIYLSSEKHSRFCVEITNLRSKLVGYTSHFDMWRVCWYELTDKQHIEIERKIIKFHLEMDEYIRDNFAEAEKQNNTSKKRCYSNISITLPTRGEGLQWKD
jgi:hypothetical protein